MAKYVFTLDHPLLPGVTEELSDDLAAKKYACIVADETNRNTRYHARVLVLDDEGSLLAAVSPVLE